MAYPTTILKNGLIKFWLRNSWGDHFETCSDSNFYADEFRNSIGSIWKMCFSSWKLCRSTIPEQQHQSERHKHMMVLEKYLDILFWRSFIDTAPLHGLWHHELSMFDIIVRDAIPTVSTLSSEHPSIQRVVQCWPWCVLRALWTLWCGASRLLEHPRCIWFVSHVCMHIC